MARATRADCVQTLQSLAECFRVLTARLGFEPWQARQEIEGLRSALAVCTADHSDLIGRCRLSFWDAMLRATAKRAGCSVLFSEDFQDGRRPEGGQFVDPSAPENRRLVDLALPGLPWT